MYEFDLWKKLNHFYSNRHVILAHVAEINLSRQLAGLLHPIGELGFVEFVVLVDVEVAHFLLLGLDGRDGTQRPAAEERHLDVFCDAMEAEEPA